MELTEFLNARLDEDEAAAKAAAKKRPGPWQKVGNHVRMIVTGANRDLVVSDGPEDVADHICRHDPVRVLREVKIKRRIVARYEFARNQVAVGAVNEAAGYGRGDDGWPLREDSHDLDVRDLAAVYSDHPGYDKAWGFFS